MTLHSFAPSTFIRCVPGTVLGSENTHTSEKLRPPLTELMVGKETISGYPAV